MAFITEKMVSVIDEMKKYDEGNKQFYKEILDKVVLCVLALAGDSAHGRDGNNAENAVRAN